LRRLETAGRHGFTDASYISIRRKKNMTNYFHIDPDDDYDDDDWDYGYDL
jgi:hypothetical protein